MNVKHSAFFKILTLSHKDQCKHIFIIVEFYTIWRRERDTWQGQFLNYS